MTNDKPTDSIESSIRRNLSASPTSKALTQRDRILALLRHRGHAGVTNPELNGVCLRYGARIFELRRQDFEIKTRREHGGVFRFALRWEPREPKPLPRFEPRPRQEMLPLFGEAHP